MAERFWQGAWWRPDHEEEVGGELTVSSSGCRLLLFGSFWDPTPEELAAGVGFPLREPLRLPLIHGFAEGVSFSLLGAQCDFPRPWGVRTGTERWEVDAAVEEHLALPDDGSSLTFTRLRVKLSDLHTWANVGGPDTRHLFGDQFGVEVRATSETVLFAALPTGASLKILRGLSAKQTDDAYNLVQAAYLEWEAPTPRSWGDLLNEDLLPIQVLIWLAAGRPSEIASVELILSEPQVDGPARASKLWAALIELPTPLRRLHAFEPLFLAAEMSGGFEAGLMRWLELWPHLRHFLVPPYAREQASFIYANDRFSSAIAAVEGYDRWRRTSNADLPTAQHRERRKRLQSVLAEHAPDLEDWAYGATYDLNRIPLWRRVVEIFERLHDLHPALVGPALADFARQVEEARNGPAHGRGANCRLEGGEGLYVGAQILLWGLRASILLELGFEKEAVVAKVRDDRRFQHWARSLDRVLRKKSE